MSKDAQAEACSYNIVTYCKDIQWPPPRELKARGEVFLSLVASGLKLVA